MGIGAGRGMYPGAGGTVVPPHRGGGAGGLIAGLVGEKTVRTILK